MSKKLFSGMIAIALVVAMFGCSSPLNVGGDASARVAAAGPEVTYSISSWGSGFNATFTIKNTGDTEIKDWKLEFDWDWNITSNWSSTLVDHTGDHYIFTHSGWNKTIAPGASVSFGVGGVTGTAGAEPVIGSTGGTDPNDPDPTKPVLPEGPLGEIAIAYGTMSDTATAFTGNLLVGNVNTVFEWNGSYFDVPQITFDCTSQISSIKSDLGPIPFTQDAGVVTMEMGWQAMFDLGTTLDIEIIGTKAGTTPLPENFVPRYSRGEAITYPAYADLPASWSKGKVGLTAADLIADPVDYYSTAVNPFNSNFIVYNPPHATQIPIGQVYSVPYPVNTVNNVRIHIPGKLMAMGLGLVYENLKISPHYMTSLGTKENFSAGFVPPESGYLNNPVDIDGVTWYWPIMAHIDGPYQQEKGNFDDCRNNYRDYFPATANHDDYTPITVDPNDPNWVSAGYSSGLSISITRETLFAVDADYIGFINAATDPWAEMAVTTFAYNRGVSNFFSKKLLSDNRAAALASTDIAADFDMGGFAAHVPTVRAMVEAMNADNTDIYDDQISWADMEVMLASYKKFFLNGAPITTEWDAMVADVQAAFNVLAQHWGGQTVSYRFDFLTLVRVMNKHLPAPLAPRPTGPEWFYLIKNAQP